MIRIVLIAAAFMAVTIALIAMQPPNPTLDPTLEMTAPEPNRATEVTRGETGFDALGSVSSPIAAVPDPVATEAGDMATDDQVDNLQTVTALEAPAPAPAEPAADGLEQLIANALEQGRSEDYIDALVNDAAQAGTVEVPAALVTSDGRVDTSGLLAALTESRAGTQSGGAQTYVVQPGDSLAAIADRFYGSTDRYPDILDANRSILTSADQIKVGQTLTIPVE